MEITYFFYWLFKSLLHSRVYFIEKYGLDPRTANTVNSLVYFIAIVGCPLFGIIVDKTGRNVIWLGISVIGTLIAHGLLAFTQINPYVSVSIMGIFYSMLASSLWPLIALIIPERLAGTAYGMWVELILIPNAMFRFVMIRSNNYNLISFTVPKRFRT